VRPDVPCSKLAASYRAWLASSGHDPALRPVGARSFGARVAALGLGRARSSKCRYFLIDVPRLCAALGARPCAEFERLVREWRVVERIVAHATGTRA
jgi:hypothetical protein